MSPVEEKKAMAALTQALGRPVTCSDCIHLAHRAQPGFGSSDEALSSDTRTTAYFNYAPENPVAQFLYNNLLEVVSTVERSICRAHVAASAETCLSRAWLAKMDGPALARGLLKCMQAYEKDQADETR